MVFHIYGINWENVVTARLSKLLPTFNKFGPIWIIIDFVSTILLKDAKLQQFSLASCYKVYRVIEEA